MSRNRTHATQTQRSRTVVNRRRMQDARTYAEATEAQSDLHDEIVARQEARLVGSMQDILTHGVVRAGEYQIGHCSNGNMQVRADGADTVLCEGTAAQCAEWVCLHHGLPVGSRIFHPARLPRKYA